MYTDNVHSDLKCVKMIPATTGNKALLQFLSFIQTFLRTMADKIQAFKWSKQRLVDLFFKELTGVSLHKELHDFASNVHNQPWTGLCGRGFNINKNFLAKNNEELTIQSCYLIKDYLLSSKLLPHSLDKKTEIRSSIMQKINRNIL